MKTDTADTHAHAVDDAASQRINNGRG